MTVPRCVYVVLAVLAAGGCTAPSRPAIVPTTHLGSQPLRVQVAEDGNVVRRVSLDDYVRSAVISEFVPPGGDPLAAAQMLQVQAIVARTYALANRGRHGAQGFDLCSATHCQLYQPSRLKTSPWAAAVDEALRRTRGIVLWHGGGPAVAVFHADCGGHTTTPADAWRGTARPYLQAVRDDGPADSAHGRWTYAVDAAQIVAALNSDRRTQVGARLDAITILDRNASGRAETVALHGAQERLVRGEVLREVVTRQLGARTLKSTLFEVRRERTTFVFEGRGFGHGVGLCQAGAFARIRAGALASDVLERYYPGTSLRHAG
jgi:stage II sporulation protein D